MLDAHEQNKPRPANKLRLIQFRNYNSSKQIRHNYFDSQSTSPKNVPQLPKHSQPLLPSISNNEHSSNQTIRFKLSNPKERLQMIRKNLSLKQLRYPQVPSSYNKSRVEQIKNVQTFSKQDKKAIEVVQSLNNISARRGLVKKGQNKLKLQRKEKAKETLKSDVSFEECLEKQHNEVEKPAPHPKISSQNLLGNSGRKNSWVKMKALVTNPFERLIRHQQNLQEQQSNLTNLIEAKESQILSSPLDDSTSVAHTQQIQQLLSML